MSDSSAEAVELFRHELELCKVRPGETVAIAAPEGPLHARAEGFARAARSLGATAYIVTVPAIERGPGTTGRNPLTGHDDVLALLKQADLVIDLLKLLFSPEQDALQAAGCRVLLCVEPLPILRRLLPTKELRAAVEAADERLRAASQLRVTSAWGTDLVYDRGPYGTLTEYGYTDEPGRWDHWPGGFLFTHGADHGVNGTLVLKPGDLLLFARAHYVREPVTLAVRDGFVTAIDGHGLDAIMLRDFYERAGDDADAWAVSHIGWGLNRQAQWVVPDVPGSIYMDARAFAGNVLFSTGPNRELGGSRDTPFHLDIPMRDCTLLLDGKPVVDAGRLVDG